MSIELRRAFEAAAARRWAACVASHVPTLGRWRAGPASSAMQGAMHPGLPRRPQLAKIVAIRRRGRSGWRMRQCERTKSDKCDMKSERGDVANRASAGQVGFFARPTPEGPGACAAQLARRPRSIRCSQLVGSAEPRWAFHRKLGQQIQETTPCVPTLQERTTVGGRGVHHLCLSSFLVAAAREAPATF